MCHGRSVDWEGVSERKGGREGEGRPGELGKGRSA